MSEHLSERRFRLFPKEMKFLPYIWLSYWAMYVGFVLFAHMTTTRTLIGLSLLLLFLVPYRQVFWWKQKHIHLIIGAMTLISLLLILFYSPTFIYLVYYLFSPMGFLKTRRQTLLWAVGALTVLTAGLFYSLYPMPDFATPGNIISLYMSAIMMPFGMRAFQQWKQTTEELKLKNRQIDTSPSRRNGSGSPATCTTSSGIRCR